MSALLPGPGAAQPPLPLRERVGVRGRATLYDRRCQAVSYSSARPLIRLPAPSPAGGEGSK